LSQRPPHPQKYLLLPSQCAIREAHEREDVELSNEIMRVFSGSRYRYGCKNKVELKTQNRIDSRRRIIKQLGLVSNNSVAIQENNSHKPK